MLISSVNDTCSAMPEAPAAEPRASPITSRAAQGQLLLSDGIPWASLSDRSLAMIYLIAVPISNGKSHGEVAQSLGQSADWESRRLVELRKEPAEPTIG
jgi:hypothetical protein